MVMLPKEFEDTVNLVESDIFLPETVAVASTTYVPFLAEFGNLNWTEPFPEPSVVTVLVTILFPSESLTLIATFALLAVLTLI
jgi:hypothetical protein